MILKLKRFNEVVKYRQFKMDTLEPVIKPMHRNCFMALIYLQHVYYSVPVAPEDQVFLQFEYRGCLFQFTCLPMGLSSSPRVFTQILQACYAML